MAHLSAILKVSKTTVESMNFLAVEVQAEITYIDQELGGQVGSQPCLRSYELFHLRVRIHDFVD